MAEIYDEIFEKSEGISLIKEDKENRLYGGDIQFY